MVTREIGITVNGCLFCYSCILVIISEQTIVMTNGLGVGESLLVKYRAGVWQLNPESWY